MSVINQMLKDLEQQPSPSLSQRDLPTGAVTVTQPSGSRKLLVALVASITLVTGSAGYLLMQDNIAPAMAAPVVAVPAKVALAAAPSGEAVPAEMVQEPVVDNRTERVSDSAEQAVQATLIQAPATSKKQDVAPPAVVTQVAPVPVAQAEPTQQVSAQPPAKKQVASAKAVTETSENSISIKPITRTPQQQAQLYAQQAEQALLSGDKEQAKLRFNQVLKLDSSHDQAREKLAALLYGEQRTKSAVTLLREGLAVSPEHANFRLMLARIFMQNKNKQQAYYYLKPHQPEIAGHTDYYAMLAGLAQNLGDLDTALSAYLKLTAHEPNRAKWWLGLGITADKLQQGELALTAYHKAQTMGQLSAASRNYIDTRITQLEK